MRKFLFTWIALIIVQSLNAHKNPVLENALFRAEFNAENGSLIQLVNKQTGWKIVNRSFLGQSFELLMPLTDKDLRFNVVKGTEQKVPEIEQSAGKITFTWVGMRTGNMKAKEHVIFKGTVIMVPEGLEFSGELTNNGRYPVEYVSWPCLGEVTIPDRTQPLFHSTRSDSRELFPHFYNEHGYWGVDYPTSTYPLPERSYVLVNNSRQGFIAYGKKNFPANMLISSFELIPGFELANTYPDTDVMDGQPVRIQFKVNQVVYNRPGEVSVLDPVKLCLFEGPWRKGVDLYKQDRNLKKGNTPAWVKEPLTWQKVAVNHADELINNARESVQYGIDVLQVRGWYRETDGKIEELDGLKDAIEECQKLGLRIVLETNWLEVNTKSGEYMTKLRECVIKDPFGLPYDKSYLCPLSELVQRRAMDAWNSLPALLVADGYINSDNNHRNKSYLCFASNHGHKVGEPSANGTMELDRKMVDMIKSNGNKAAFGFGFLDEQTCIYDGYQIATGANHFSRQRYTDPSTTIILPIDVRNARVSINEAVRCRFNISYDFKFFSNQLKDCPLITDYGQRVEAFRKRYHESVWDADFLDTDEALVEGKNITYSVFSNKNNGKRAVVVINTSTDQSTFVKVAMDHVSSMQVASPENPDKVPYKDHLEIKPQSLIVIFEQ